MAELQEIKIEDMGFSYSSDPVLSDVDLTLKAGNKYAIVGESGGGKTTLINLILKLLTPTDGSISRNGTSYGDITCGDIISSVAYVGQDPVMLPADVRTNIITDKPYDKALLEKVITLSRLSEGRSPDEVEEFLSGSAESLSGGERKRVALARALYKQRSVLILDEVLSSVSKDMAVAMENAILALDGVMVIHITHSLFEEQRKKYDGIITVGQGKAEYTAVSALQCGSL